MSDRPARLLLALLVLGTLVFLTGCVDFPASHTVCLTCEKGIENATVDGSNVSVESSELHIQVREDGTSRWTVRSNLTGEGVEKLRSNPDQVSQFARASVTGQVGDLAPYAAIHDGNVTNISAQMDGRVLVLSFTVKDAAMQGFDDVLLVDYFNTERRGPPSYNLGTDRVILRGPPGTVVTTYPTEANIMEDGQAVVWQSPNTWKITGKTYVAFVPEHQHPASLSTRATITANVAQWAAPKVAQVGFFYSVVMSAVIPLISFSLANVWTLRRVGQGTSVRARFADRPPVDIPAVVLLYAGLIAAVFGDFGESRGLTFILFVIFPLIPLVLFFLLGLSIDRYPLTSRAITLFLGGTPFVMASALVLDFPSSGPLFFTTLVPVFIALLLGIPLFFLGIRVS